MDVKELRANAANTRENAESMARLAGNISSTCPNMAKALRRCCKKMKRRTEKKPHRGATHARILRGSLVNAVSIEQVEEDAANWLQSVPETMTHDETGEEVP